MINSRLLLVVLAGISLLLGACSPLPREAQKRFFWPPPPNEPKIEFINYYLTINDLERGLDKRWETAILGAKKPVRLFVQPYSVASNGKGVVYVTDFSGGRLVAVDLVKHDSRTVAQLGADPQKVTIDALGDIWVLLPQLKQIKRFNSQEEEVELLQLDESFKRPTSLAVDRKLGRIYAVDTPAHIVHVLDLLGRPLSTIGRRGELQGEFNFPTDIDLDAAGNLYVLDTLNARIQVFSPDGAFLRAFGERGSAPGSFGLPKGLAVSTSGLVCVTEAQSSKVVIFSLAGEYLMNFGGREIFDGKRVVPGGFYYPIGIDIDDNDTIWIADIFNNALYEYQHLTPAYLQKHPVRPEDIYYDAEP